jgi:hypothetical protein
MRCAALRCAVGARRSALGARRSAVGGRQPRAAAAARDVDGGAAAPGGGGGVGFWCACSEINQLKKLFKNIYLFKKKPHTAAVGHAART